MKYFAVNSSILRWRIHTSSQTQIKLASDQELILLSPFHFSRAYESLRLLKSKKPLMIFNSECHIDTGGILLKTSNMTEINDETFNFLNRFFGQLRFESAQVSINGNRAFSSIGLHNRIPTGKCDTYVVTKFGVRSDFYDTMLTWEIVKNTNKVIKKSIQNLPYEEIFLEAYKAFTESEYNKVILLSIISIEAMLANCYDSIYLEKSKISNRNSHMRWILNPKENKFQDPIYKALSDRNDFRKLLHEIPLYLLKKSILVENEKLYKTLIKMYNTRNKIVHWGAPIEHDSSKLIEISNEGALLAINAANSCFKWIGISKFDHLVNYSFRFYK